MIIENWDPEDLSEDDFVVKNGYLLFDAEDHGSDDDDDEDDNDDNDDNDDGGGQFSLTAAAIGDADHLKFAAGDEGATIRIDLQTFSHDFKITNQGDGSDLTILFDGANEVFEDADGTLRVTFTGADGEEHEVKYAPGGAEVSVFTVGEKITGGGGSDVLAGGDGGDDVNAGVGDDRVDAGGGNDRVAGGLGADSLDGGEGLDTLVGGTGNDTLIGGEGADRLIGGGDNSTIAGETIDKFSFKVANISERGGEFENWSDVGKYVVYDNVGVTEKGAIVQARISVDGVSHSHLNVDLGVADNAPVVVNDGIPLYSQETADIRIEFFDQATGEAIAINGFFTFKDLDATTESVTIGKNDAETVAISTSPRSNIEVADNGDSFTLNSTATSNSGSADQENWATVSFNDQLGMDFTVSGRIGGNAIYDFASADFDAPPEVIQVGEGDDDSLSGGLGGDTLEGGVGDDILSGDSGDDLIDGGSGDDVIAGGFGADRLFGGGGGDRLGGGSGDDVIYGGTGDDSLTTGSGNDQLFGGAGADDLRNSSGDDSLVGGSGDDSITASIGSDTLEGGQGHDTLIGGSGDDSLVGGIGQDSIDGGIGADAIVAGDESDIVDAGAGADSIDAGAGGDTINAGSGDDTITGGDGGDSIFGGAGADSIVSGATTDQSSGQGLGVQKSFSLIKLTNAADIDTNEGDTDAENPASLFGTYGGAGSPLHQAIVRATTTDADADGNADLDHNDNPDTVTIDGDAVQIDSGVVYNATVTFTDGTSGSFSAVVMQLVDGDVYLLPELSQNADADLLESKPIQSISLDSVAVNPTNLAANRLDIDYKLPDEDTVDGGAGADTIEGGAGDDNLGGGSGDDQIFGGLGSDLIFGGGGEDFISVGLGDDSAFGGAGDDTILNASGDDSLVGGSGDDSIVATGGADTLEGGAGADTLIGGSGDDCLVGGSGDDVITGSSGDDVAFGGDDQDTFLFADDFGNDTIEGGEGGTDFDTLDFSSLTAPVTVTYTGDEAGTATDGIFTITFSEIEGLILTSGDDALFGGADSAGIDVIAGAGADTIYGGVGGDSIDGGSGADEVFGDAGDDTIFGGSGADDLGGDSGDDIVSGGSGDDFVQGMEGADTLEGGVGADTLDGGAGNDSLTGGDGFDVFVLSSGDDTIADFGTATGGALNDGDPTNNDFIDLSAYYDNIWEARADFADDGILNQSNATDAKGRAVDYGDNTAMSGGTTFQGVASSSAFTQDNTNLVCFAAGTQIATPGGARPVDALAPGDLIATLDRGAKPVRWVGRRVVSVAEQLAAPWLRPVRIRAGALGPGFPTRDLLVSPQHRVLARGPIAARMFGAPEVLLPAKALLDAPGVEREPPRRDIAYVHICLDGHQVIWAEDALTETFYPGPQAMRSLSEADFAAFTQVRFATPPGEWTPARPLAPVRPAAAFVRRAIAAGQPIASPSPQVRAAS